MELRTDYSNVSFQNNGKLKLLIIVGTRPEIIRLAAVINKTRQLSLPIPDRTMITILMVCSSKISS